MTPEKITILDEAARLTSSDRQRDYGHPYDNHTTTAMMWSAYMSRKLGIVMVFDATDVCVLNILQKLSRHANSPKRDNLVDVAGYARNAEMVEEAKQEKERRTK